MDNGLHGSGRALPVVLWLAAGISACAAPHPVAKEAPPTAAAASGRSIQCRIERPTGSNLGAQVCTNQEQRDAIKATTRSMQQDLGRVQAGACPPPGCNQ